MNQRCIIAYHTYSIDIKSKVIKNIFLAHILCLPGHIVWRVKTSEELMHRTETGTRTKYWQSLLFAFTYCGPPSCQNVRWCIDEMYIGEHCIMWWLRTLNYFNQWISFSISSIRIKMAFLPSPLVFPTAPFVSGVLSSNISTCSPCVWSPLL